MHIRIILAAAICVMAMSCNTLKLAINTKAPDGSRLLATTDVNLFSDEGDEFYTAMGMKPGEKDTLLAISISTNKASDSAMFEKGNTLTIVFENGSKIVLKNMLDSYMEVENNFVYKSKPVHGTVYDYYYTPWVGLVYAAPYQVAGYVPSPGIERTTSSYALYMVSASQLKNISGQAIIRFEIQAGKHRYEMERPQTASEIYCQLYDYLLERLNGKKSASS